MPEVNDQSGKVPLGLVSEISGHGCLALLLQGLWGVIQSDSECGDEAATHTGRRNRDSSDEIRPAKALPHSPTSHPVKFPGPQYV